MARTLTDRKGEKDSGGLGGDRSSPGGSATTVRGMLTRYKTDRQRRDSHTEINK